MDCFHKNTNIKEINTLLTAMIEKYYSQDNCTKISKNLNEKEMSEKYFSETPPEKGENFGKILSNFEENILADSVKTWHPKFLNQMSAGAPFPAIIGDLLASMLNPTLATWEVAPVATVIERNVSEWMASIIGMPKGSSGIFVPGGSFANLLALTIARNEKYGLNKIQSGKWYKNEVVICSDASHYSIKNAVDLLGIGSNNLHKIQTNSRNEMNAEEFLKAVEFYKKEKIEVIAVIATLGGTVTGGIDPLKEIGKICRNENIHFHVDAAFGGGMAFTDIARQTLQGIEMANSITWDAHKWLHIPLTCTALLVPDIQILKKNFNSQADYLFHKQNSDTEKSDDLGQYTILCGKKFDSLKLWLLWKTYGTDFFRKSANNRLKVTKEFFHYLQEDPELEPCYEPRTPLQCFRFIVPKKKKNDIDYKNKLHRFVRKDVISKRNSFFNITKLKGIECFRLVLINPLTELIHLREIAEEIKQSARKFIAEN